jgi:hypothetical protein
MVEPAVQYVPPLFSIEDVANDAKTVFLDHHRRRT